MTTRTPLTVPMILAVSVALACQPQGERAGDAAGPAAVDTAAIVSSLDSLRSAFEEVVAAGDWQRLGAMVAEDARIVQAGGAAWDSMRAASETPFPPGATIEITSSEARVLSADWAYDMGNGQLTYTPEGADEPVTLRDTYLVLLHRTPAGWKIFREVASSHVPPEGGE